MSGSRIAPAFLSGVFLICMCGLMLQIVETRVISVIAYYHLAFFAISMAMLGMTAGSLLVYFQSHWFTRERLFENLAWISCGFAVAVVVSTLTLITTVVNIGIINTFAMTALIWFKLIITLLPPYVFAGMAISLALTRSPVPVGIVYGVDLLGASSGCLVVLALLEWADAVSLLIAIAAFAALAGLFFQSASRTAGEKTLSMLAAGRGGKSRWPAILAVLFGVIAVGNAAIQPTRPGVYRDGLVLLSAKGTLENVTPALARWNTYSRILVSAPYDAEPKLWSPSPITPDMTTSQRDMNIDGQAATAMYQFNGDIKTVGYLKYDLTNLAYTVRNQGRSAVIGVGGGRDILSAYMFGFRDITGVELNTIFIDLLTRDFRDYNHVADLPGVKLHVDEARSWFARTDEKFDLIEMSLIDTWAATGAGAYSLSENGLYTTQGWHHFLGALTPTGVFTVSRWFNPTDITETGRLISLAAASLRNKGIDAPEKHIFLAGSDKLATLMVGNAAFTPAELTALRAKVAALQFKVLLSPDQLDPSNILTQIVTARDPETLTRLSRQQHVDVSVTTDDRPYFFNQLNALDIDSIKFALHNTDGVVHGNLLATMTLLMVMGFSGMLVLFTMIFPSLPSVRQTSKALAQSGTLYFMLIGFGFMFVEIGLIQRLSTFLGHPVYGLAIGLFGIILSTGIGSLVSEVLPLDSPRRIVIWSALLAIYLALLPFWFPSLVAQFEGDTLFTRILMSLLAIIPSGILMGYGFPTGMRLVNAVDTGPTPWFWAVNGAAGVLAASATVAISIAFSINTSLWLGAGAYVLIAPVAIMLLSLSRPGVGVTAAAAA